MSQNTKESLFARWSRLKRESTAHKDEATGTTARDRDGDRIAGGSGKSGVDAERRVDEDGNDQRGSNKQDSKEQGSIEQGGDAPLQLPSLDELGPDSDYQAFMDPGVDDETRRAALKMLFRDPAFNVTDGLDVYAEDYTKLEKLTPAMVAALRYAQRNLFGESGPSEPMTGTEGASSGGDAGERVSTADQPLQSGEKGPVTEPAANRSGSNAGGGDRQAGVMAETAGRDPMPGEQFAEHQGTGRTYSGTRSG